MSRLTPSRCLAIALLLVLALTGPSAAERRVVAPPGTDLGLPFSPGILSDDSLFLSGAIGNRPGTVEVTGGAAAQTRRTLENLVGPVRPVRLVRLGPQRRRPRFFCNDFRASIGRRSGISSRIDRRRWPSASRSRPVWPQTMPV